MKIFFRNLLLFYLTTGYCQAQLLKVVDEQQKAIPDVSVYNQDSSVYRQTNKEGIIDVAPFHGRDTLFFQHSAYLDRSVARSDVKEKDDSIVLQEKVIQMVEMTVQANRWEQQQGVVAQQVTTLSRRAISFYNPQTAADALESTGEVFVQKSQLGGGSPMLRGFAANAVLLVVDGVRMNNAIFRSGNLQHVINIDPAVLQEAEVIFGPASVMYGSDALGGVMSFHTRQPDFQTGEPLWSAGAFARFSSANLEKTMHADLSFGRQRWSMLSSFSFSDFGSLRAGNWWPEAYPDLGKRHNYVVPGATEDLLVANDQANLQVPSGYKQLSAMQKIRYRPFDLTELTYGLLYSTTSDIPRYDRLLLEDENGLPVHAVWYYGPQEWMMHYLKADFFAATSLYDELKVTLAYQAMQESRHERDFQHEWLRSRTENVNAFTLNADAEKMLRPGHQLFYGAEVVYNDVTSAGIQTNMLTSEVEGASTRYPDGGSNYQTAALYVQQQWDIYPKLILNTGLRYSSVNLASRFRDTTFFHFPYSSIKLQTQAMSGSAGLIFRPQELWKLSFLFSTGFRAPNVDDIGKVFDSEPGSIIVPNPGLRPEYSYNAEWSVSRVWKDRFRFNAVAYYSWLRDAMVRRPFTFHGEDSIMYDEQYSRVQALTNAGKAYVWGFSISASAYAGNSWHMQSSISYNTGKDKKNQMPLRHTTPLFGRTAVTFQKSRWKAAFYARYHGARSFQDLPPSERNKMYLYTPEGVLPWFTLNTMSTYQVNSHLQLQVGVENILDKHYRPYASGISAPGRNAIISLRGNFPD